MIVNHDIIATLTVRNSYFPITTFLTIIIVVIKNKFVMPYMQSKNAHLMMAFWKKHLFNNANGL